MMKTSEGVLEVHKNIHNLFITIVLIYIITYIYIYHTFTFVRIEDWMEEAKGYAMYYYDPKDLIPSSHTTED